MKLYGWSKQDDLRDKAAGDSWREFGRALGMTLRGWNYEDSAAFFAPSKKEYEITKELRGLIEAYGDRRAE